MRNLEVTSCVVLPADPLLSGARCFCLDCDSGSAWVVTERDSRLWLACITQDHHVSLTTSLADAGHGTKVVDMEYVSDLESVCLALSSGNIITCNTITHEVEVVGSVSGGVVAMSWSPEQDLVVLATAEGNLILMTREFDPLLEIPMCPPDFGEAKPVTVGWGQKSTQFHGSLGKPTAPQAVDEQVQLWDDLRPRISWRGDGEFFVCSSVDTQTGGRRLRVWSRECALQSTSEGISGLEQALCWRPSGNLIASTQLRPHRHDVIFFERNGLRHGEFPLPGGRLSVQVKELLWNSDSSVMALWLEEEGSGEGRNGSGKDATKSEGTDESRAYVQLWYMNNYHWYLKQELALPSHTPHLSPASLTGVLWDPIAPLKLHLLTHDGQYLCYSWRWSVAEGAAHSPDSMANVAVIDGANLLLTSLRYLVVPPPMAAHTLLLPCPALQVTFAPSPKCNDFLVLLASGEVAVYCYREGGGPLTAHQAPELMGVTKLLAGSAGVFCLHTVRQLRWWRPDRLVGVASGEGGGQEEIVEFSIKTDWEKVSLEVARCLSCPSSGPTLTLTTNPDTLSAIAQLQDGTILRLSNASGKLSPWQLPSGLELKLPDQACEQIALANFGGEEGVVSLNPFRRMLHVNGERILTGCTSFCVHDNFLILTTDSHLARFLPLNAPPTALTSVTSGQDTSQGEGVRRIERGSKIVTAVTHDVKLVLQMPRGNLETVCPRALVLHAVRRSLDKLQFREAFLTMRKHRVNLNLLHDHNPQVLLDHVVEFIEQLGAVAHINLFLTELREEDVTETLYQGLWESTGTRSERGRGGGKVDRVCDAVREALEKLGENRYLLSIITAHVRKTRPELEAVLRKIKQLKESPPTNSSVGEGECVTAEEALRYALFLVDVNELFDVALGMYDFGLVLMVAEKSQKDPKEYLPFLNDLRQLPTHYQHYRIDCHLRRFSKALESISRCDSGSDFLVVAVGPERFDDCLSLVREHSLYSQALEIYTDHSSTQYQMIARAYGDHLLQKGKPRDAGIVLEQCGALPEAMSAFEKAGCWRQLFSLSARLRHDVATRSELARRVASSLKARRLHPDAATVLLDYTQDVEEAVVTLLEGSAWEEAIRIMHLHDRSGMLETHLVPSLLEAQSSQLVLMESLHSSFTQRSSRLNVVREEKQRKQAAIMEGTYAADERDADLFSDTSSMTGVSSVNTYTSVGTKTSGRSAKNRRKAERKRYSLREGSSYEDLALMEALGETVGTVDRMQDDTASLLGVLVTCGYVKEAREVQTKLEELMAAVREHLPSIWSPPPPPPTSGLVGQGATGPGTTVNSIVAAMATAGAQPTATVAVAPKLRDVPWKMDLLH